MCQPHQQLFTHSMNTIRHLDKRVFVGMGGGGGEEYNTQKEEEKKKKKEEEKDQKMTVIENEREITQQMQYGSTSWQERRPQRTVG